MKKTPKQKIKSYFDNLRKQNDEFANYHSAAAKGANNQMVKNHHESAAWHYGVQKPAMLNDMEKDILKLI